MIKIIIPLLCFAIGYYFQWQAKRIREARWHAPNSYALGKMYKQIERYELISKIVYIASISVACAAYLY